MSDVRGRRRWWEVKADVSCALWVVLLLVVVVGVVRFALWGEGG